MKALMTILGRFWFLLSNTGLLTLQESDNADKWAAAIWVTEAGAGETCEAAR
jgi:hypothetical protein